LRRAVRGFSCRTAVMILAAAIAAGAVRIATAAEPATSSRGEPVLTGEADYLVHCASCHGADGRGDGPVAELLKQRPTDLTLLSEKNGGRFPEKRAFEVIDGAAVVRAHGTREMPVWGDRFRVQAANAFNRPQTEREIRARIERLIGYLKSLQRK
jgi:mono/diheme cytochrome c family protein